MISESQNNQWKYEDEKHWGVTMPGDMHNIAYYIEDKTIGTLQKKKDV